STERVGKKMRLGDGHRLRVHRALAVLDRARGDPHDRAARRRRVEQQVRRAVAACDRWARASGLSGAQGAGALGPAGRPLRSWVAARDQRPRTRGRVARPLGQPDRQQLRAAMLVHRGHVGVATLQRWCPIASRRSLRRWLREYWRALRRGLRQLTWTRAGRVWAMDGSQPLLPIDGRYRYVVHLRDLASGEYLAALPVSRPTASVVCDLLRAVCARHGVPLVLKVDNGAAFRSDVVRRWASGVGLRLLYSPPVCPRYNGSIEASIGALGARLHHTAAALG